MRWIRFDDGGHPLPGSFSVQQPGAGQWIADEDVPAVQAVPYAVTAAQGGIALIQANLMDAVQAAADAPDTPADVKWAWARATTWERVSPALNYLADKAGVSAQQMDDLFIVAGAIQP